MIKTLQKRFITTAMIAITVLLAVMLGAVNMVNAWSTRQEAGQLLDSLVKMELMQPRFDPDNPSGGFDGAQQEREDPPPPQEPRMEDDAGEKRGRGFMIGAPTENDRISAVCFTAVTSEGAVQRVDLSRIGTITEADAAALAEQAAKTGKETGRIDSFRYQSAKKEDGTTVYVFLDVTARRNAVLRVVALSALAGAAGWGLMLLLVILLSKKAIAPIAANMERQKQFVTDAGHELKTPLSIIQANTEAMELISGENKWSRNIRAQVTRLTDLTGNLLILARAEEAPSENSFLPVDLSALAEKSAQMFLPSLEQKGLTLESSVTPELTVRGNASQLTSLCSILLDNAVKYADGGSPVLLTLRRADRSVLLRVENSCAALPECAPERLFDRFYRADEARTQKSGGFGIGLSAAKVIAQQHRGSLKAEYPDDHRIAFTVALPEYHDKSTGAGEK